jgi:3-hydroxyisobutyrate dehydrogenase
MFSYFYFPVNREVAQVSDVVFTMVGYPKDVEEVILGSEGVLHGLKPGSIVIDMTTSRPSLGFSVSFILTQ